MEVKYPRIFKKAIKGAVGGVLLNNRGNEEEFILKGDPATTDLDKITVEIPSEEAYKYFVKNNKSTVVNGFLIEITEGYELSLDEINAVTDGFLKDLLKQSFPAMKKRVEAFTSSVPVARLLHFAEDANKPYKTVEFLKEALAKFNTTKTPNVAEISGIKVSGST
jgi:hypothetical protein